MSYKKIIPIKQLQPYVRHFGVFESDNDSNILKTFKIIVDGCPGLIFQESINCFLDKNKKRLPQLFLHGLTTEHSQKTCNGYFRNIGIFFQPNAIKSIFGIDANELTNHHVDLNLLFKNNLSEQLLEVSCNEKRIEILTRFILQKIDKKKNSNTCFIIEKIKEKGAAISFQQIQSEFNLSERSLERIFKTDVGISPKLFLRINRFQLSLNYIRNQKFDSLTEVAYEHFYSDQSHFIREFKEFSGATPTQFIQYAYEQAVNFPEWKS